MFRSIIALVLLLAAAPGAMAACASTANRAGCATPNGAVTYNKNTGQAHGVQTGANQVAPGTNVQGKGGNSATKAVQPGCAFVNGKRVCN